MKILLSSVGRRGYLVKYFKEALGPAGQVWGADSSPFAPAFAYCDGTAILPEVKKDHYPKALLDLCRTNRIDIVVPLIDPELEVLSGWRQAFEKEGVMIVLSPAETIAVASDKYLTCQFAKVHGLGTPLAFLTVEEAMESLDARQVNWPLLVKPRRGSASIDITRCYDKLQIEAAVEAVREPMIQEFVAGIEYGYDLFGDCQGRPVSVYCKKKLSMRAGETDKAVSVNDSAMIEFGTKLLSCMKLVGPADVDAIEDKEGIKLLEINPRFGGGYPCSHLAGADFCKKIIAMRNGRDLKPDIGSCPSGVCMLKQDEIIRPDWPLRSD
ncbi:MAG: ATP-grasp domain-containing protein [Planctomycetales bacterium]|nr:ATP-grasp domain-containing protein [Planctomycetales bacterium]